MTSTTQSYYISLQLKYTYYFWYSEYKFEQYGLMGGERLSENNQYVFVRMFQNLVALSHY